MEKMVIPHAPASLHISIQRFWNGEECPNELHADVWISQSPAGLIVKGVAKTLPDEQGPDLPNGTRVDGLWNHHVVEVFLVGKDGRYLEIELGAKGHWLVLGFDAIRHRSNEYIDFKPVLRYTAHPSGTWESEITIPWEMVSTPLERMNAFAFVATGNNFLAAYPMPGAEPDFHQPSTYPLAEIAA